MAKHTRAKRKAAKDKAAKDKAAKGKVAGRPKQVNEARAWAGIDPYVSWALGTGRNGYFIPGRQVPGNELMPLALRLEGDVARAFQAGAFLQDNRDRKRWQASLQVLGRLAQGVGQDEAVWLAAMAPADLRTKIAGALSSRALREAPRRLLLGRPLDTQALVGKVQAPAPAPSARARRRRPRSMAMPVNPPAVVMGIIDDGIAFANERFLHFPGPGLPPTSRVEFWWLQDGAFNALPFGRKLAKAAIDPILAACTDANGKLDEELFYRRVRLLDPDLAGHKSAAWRAAHGTHVMDLACGFDPNPPVNDRPIVCVQLPTRATQDEEPGNLAFYIAQGIDFIVQCAQAIALSYGGVPLPVVINLSYGLLADPHDGTSIIETFIEDKIVECAALGIDLRVVLPAGNSYLSRTHAHITFAAAPETKTLHWRVLPDDRTPTFVEIWLPRTVPEQSRVTLTIRSPTGAAWNISELVLPSVPFGPAPHYGAASYFPWLARGYFIIALQPTADPLDLPVWPPTLFAPAGIWDIDITHNLGLAPQDIIHAWVRRDDLIYSFPTRGRQSFFDHPDYLRFDHAGRDEELDSPASLVRRESTLNSMATGRSTIVIGGFLRKERIAAKYTSGGAAPLTAPWPPPGPPPHPRWPDAAAVSDDSLVHAGVLAAGSRSNSVVAMNGSSVSAPQIARVVADRLAGGNPGNRLDIQGLAVIPLATRPGPPMRGRTGRRGVPTVPLVSLNRYDWP